MKLASRVAIAVSLAVMFVISSGCAGGKALRSESVGDSGHITGPFTLILYHEAVYDGLKTLAFLVPEGNGYTLEPYVPSFDYTVIRGVGAQDALQRARAFVSNNPSYQRNEVSRILGWGDCSLRGEAPLLPF
jgi:hypothetical protein